MKKIIIIFLVLIAIQNSFGQVSQKYSAEQVKQDLKYLYSTLQESHYNLYVNTPKEKYDKEYQKIYNSVKDSLNALQIIRLFQPFVALSKIGHCSCDLSFVFNDVYDSYIKNGGTLFPICVTVINNKMIIIDNYSNNKDIKNGEELVSINGKSAKNILNGIYASLSGENDYYINTLVDLGSFPRFNWLMNDPCDSYNIQIKNKKNEIIKYTIPAINAWKFEELQGQKKQVFNSGRRFKFIDETAYLQPGPFLNANGDGNLSNVKTHENGEFIKFIDSAFLEIHKAGSKNLIIDLRDNQGGDNTFSDEMIAFFADKPFKFCSRFSVKSSQKTKEFWKQLNDTTLSYLKTQILNTPDGATFDVEVSEHGIRQDSLKFKGKVYVLVNRYSYSQAAGTASQIQDYKFGILIGEKTAQIPSIYGSIQQFELPNTKMQIQYPKAFIIRPNGSTKFEGVTPDIFVEDNMFTDKDEILDYTLNLIKEGNKNLRH
jgi:hypothetical protein